MADIIFGGHITLEQRTGHVLKRLGGITHLSARTPRDPLPGESVTLQLTLGPAHSHDRAWVYWSIDGSNPQGSLATTQAGSSLSMQELPPVWDTQLWGYIRRFKAVLPGQPSGTLVRYRISAGTATGEEAYADDGRLYAYLVDEDTPPAWTREAVIYQIFVDRFNPGEGERWNSPDSMSGFFGGTLKGILDKLDYIHSLGANTIWLSPIFPSPTHHGYDATDYFDVEPRLGTKADLKALLDAAHARGMRILLDFVANHWSNEHPIFQSAQTDPNSPYRDWFTFPNWPEEYESYFGVQSMPKINLQNPEARQYLLDSAVHWLELGVDGFRLDYAIGPEPAFWADFRQATRRAKPDSWTFGEVIEIPDDQVSFEGLLDGCLDFNLLEALRNTFAFQSWSPSDFVSFLAKHEAFFPASFSRPSFLDNHDMNRILWVMGDDRDRLRLAALCQFTLSGPPIIYYGTEAGLSQAKDMNQDGWCLFEECRTQMDWSEAMEMKLYEYYRELTQLRKEHPAIVSGERIPLYLAMECIAYMRESDDDRIVVLLNASGSNLSLDLPGDWPHCLISSRAGSCIEAGGGSTGVHLPPWTGVVLSG